jgi:hypothetical protein
VRAATTALSYFNVRPLERLPQRPK